MRINQKEFQAGASNVHPATWVGKIISMLRTQIFKRRQKPRKPRKPWCSVMTDYMH